MRSQILSRLLASTFLLCLLFSCKHYTRDKVYEPTYVADTASQKTIILGVPNLPYYDLLEPLVQKMNLELKTAHIKMIACSNFNDYLRKLGNRQFDMTIVNGGTALDQLKNGYEIVGKMAEDSSYKGVIIVNKDSAIETFSSLKGLTISTSGKEALAGYMLPAYMLHKNGVNVETDVKLLQIASMESVILNVFHGKCSAGFTWFSTFQNFIRDRPEINSKVSIRWVTEFLPNVAVLLKSDLDPNLKKRIVDLLLTIHKDEDGKNALKPFGVTHFDSASVNTYDPIRKFIRNYRKAFK